MELQVLGKSFFLHLFNVHIHIIVLFYGFCKAILTELIKFVVNLGMHCRILLNIWLEITARHPDAAARECRALLPLFVKLGWSWSHGQTQEYFSEQVFFYKCFRPRRGS